MFFNKKKIGFIVKIFVSALILIYIFSKVDVKESLLIIKQTKYFLLFIAVLFSMFPLVLLAWRWKILLKVQDIRVSLKKIYFLILLSNFYSLFLPGRISSDIVKGYKLLNSNKNKKEEVFLSVLMDRGIGLFSTILLSAAILLFYADSRNILQINVHVLTMIIIFLIFVLIFLFNKDFEKVIMEKVKPIMPDFIKKNNLLNRVFLAIKIHWQDKNVLFFAIILSILGQLGNIFTSYLICLSLGINLSFFTLSVIMFCVTFLLMIPISFSGLGVRDGALLFLMKIYSVEAEKAIAFSLLIFFLNILIYSIIGVVMELFFSQQIQNMQ